MVALEFTSHIFELSGFIFLGVLHGAASYIEQASWLPDCSASSRAGACSARWSMFKYFLKTFLMQTRQALVVGRGQH